jgi:hypothetical protein
MASITTTKLAEHEVEVLLQTHEDYFAEVKASEVTPSIEPPMLRL